MKPTPTYIPPTTMDGKPARKVSTGERPRGKGKRRCNPSGKDLSAVPEIGVDRNSCSNDCHARFPTFPAVSFRTRPTEGPATCLRNGTDRPTWQSGVSFDFQRRRLSEEFQENHPACRSRSRTTCRGGASLKTEPFLFQFLPSVAGIGEA